ncbi:FecR domain-containing protein [Paenibacillaceae bacterium WGS1546]|uniref:FecR domain-containing protein n=1 Tax=Cohnella sp. WGS1546 TaxID=3366810 RepID=UPI00372CF491
MLKKLTLRWLVLLLAALPLLGVLADESSAATSRVAVIGELKGTVKVKKAGGSKEFTAFARMSLNEGDILKTEKGASATLQFANGTSEDDRMTVGENSTITFSKLSNRSGTQTKVSMLKGSAWVEVKSIESSNDQFQLETPTAVMGVRGTHFLATVNPVTGQTTAVAASGIVNVSGGSGPSGPSLNVYPSQQITVFPGDTGSSFPAHPSAGQIEDFIEQASPEVIRRILQNIAEIQAENEQLKQRMQQNADNGSDLLTHNGPVNDMEQLQRFLENLNHFVGNIAKNAVEQGKVSREETQRLIDEANRKIPNPNDRIDLDNVKPFDPTSGMDPELEKAKRKAQEAMERREQQAKQQQENQDRLASMIQQLEQQRQEQEAANRRKLEEAKENAARKWQEQTSPPASTGGGSGGGNPGGSPGSGNPGGNPGTPEASRLLSLKITIAGEEPRTYEPPSTNITLDAPYRADSVTVSASGSTGSSIEIAGTRLQGITGSKEVALNVGPNEILVKVKETGKSETTYMLTIIRGEQPEEFYGVKYWDQHLTKWVELVEFPEDPAQFELPQLPIHASMLWISPKWSADRDITEVNLFEGFDPVPFDPVSGGFMIDLNGLWLREVLLEIHLEDESEPVTGYIVKKDTPEGIAWWNLLDPYAGLHPVGYNLFSAVIPYFQPSDFLLEIGLEDTVEYVEVAYPGGQPSGRLYPQTEQQPSVSYAVYGMNALEGPLTVEIHYVNDVPPSIQQIWVFGEQSEEGQPFVIKEDDATLEVEYMQDYYQYELVVDLYHVPERLTISTEPLSGKFLQSVTYGDAVYLTYSNQLAQVQLDSALAKGPLDIRVMNRAGWPEYYTIHLNYLPGNIQFFKYSFGQIGERPALRAIENGVPHYDIPAFSSSLQLEVKLAEQAEIRIVGEQEIEGREEQMSYFFTLEYPEGETLFVLVDGNDQPIAKFTVQYGTSI